MMKTRNTVNAGRARPTEVIQAGITQIKQISADNSQNTGKNIGHACPTEVIQAGITLMTRINADRDETLF